VRVGGVGISYEPPTRIDDPAVRVAFAIGRTVGTAVVRNRLRRRLRHVLAGCDPTELPPGTYLFRLAPSTAALSYQELSATVIRALERLRVVR
jgi:ribonuclease P protein component